MLFAIVCPCMRSGVRFFLDTVYTNAAERNTEENSVSY